MFTVAEFLQTRFAGIAIYGIDGGGIATDIYLRKLGLHEHVQCFLTDSANAPARFCNKPVRPLVALREMPGASVITANLDFNNVHDKIRARGFTNAFFYHASFWPWLDDESPRIDRQFLQGFYNQGDRHTQQLLEALLTLRFNPEICRIQPYAAVKDTLYVQDTYWLEGRALTDTALTIIDAGAFNGDTMESLFKAYGSYIKRYHAFEPMPHIFTQLQQSAQIFSNLADIDCRNIALYNQNADMTFHKGVPRSSRISTQGDTIVPCRKLDDLELVITGKACLKMDIEGAELTALSGAAEFIKTYKPHLALCLYHKANDIYKIPQYIKSLAPEYEFTLAGGVHTICYGMTPAK